jgi:outer membrane receptor protein involved in Fe transport
MGDRNAVRRSTVAWAVASVLGLAQQAAQAAEAARDEPIERVIVTAQRKEENLVDVPIAVSAFDSTQLERRQIDQATDLQLNIPNVSYTKTNFTSSNFQIRGIGVSSVGASSDSGVETHFNAMPIKNPRLFETEYFDIERVEVLRGPQGTLYGRNATGGAVNVIPKKPDHEKFGADVEVQAGNYGELKGKGALNVPLGEAFAMRFAAIAYERDGFTKNIYTGNDIDGRDQWAARAGFRLAPGDNTDVTLTVNYYEEDSSRARTVKQMCHRDPLGAYGCLPDRLEFGTVNGRATLAGVLAELVPIIQQSQGVPLPGLVLPGTDINQAFVNPADLRKVSAEFDPTYEADETIATLEFVHDFGTITLTSVTGYQETTFVGRTDYNWNSPTGPYNGPGRLLFPTGIPLSDFDDAYRGVFNNEVLLRSDRSFGRDESNQEADQFSQEIRIASDFEGAINFQLGALYFDAETDDEYLIATTELDWAALVLNLQPPFYANSTPSAALTSTAVFGELYWDMNDKFKWTAGLRYTRDEKEIKDRTMLLDVPSTAPQPGFRIDDTTFEEFTGRFGFDFKPGWGDDSTLYAFYSRGYKAGGFNPPFQNNPAFAGTPQVYDPEFVNAFEVGSKNVLAGGRVQANLSAFYYQYDGLQVSKIVARTSVNENVDADVYGLEGEFVVSPIDGLVFDLNLAYLKTEIGDFSSIDPRDPSNGNPAYTVVKDAFNASNYVMPTANLAAARAAGVLMPAGLGGPFGLCSNAAAAAGCAFFGQTNGIEADLSGNELAGAPEFSAKLGAQYAFGVGGGMQLIPRFDYYWRDSFYARIFNKPIDKIDSWDVLNAQITLTSANDTWYVRGYVNNVMDDDNITGMYVTDASSGLFTNVFALDPRTYGLAVGFHF